jgi:hypothetical protein
MKFSKKGICIGIISILSLISLAIVIVNFSHEKSPGINDNALVDIDGKQHILKESFIKEACRRGGNIHGRFDDTLEKEKLLNHMIQYEILALQAKKEGYDKDPEIVDTLKKLMVKKYWQKKISKAFDQIEISDTDVRQYYEKNLQKYSVPQMRSASIIYFRQKANASENEMNKLHKKARAVIDELAESNTQELFRQLARTNSDEISNRRQGGDMGWIAKGSNHYKWNSEIIDTVFSLKSVGEISSVIQTQKGLYIVRFTGIKEKNVQPLDQVAKNIEQLLMEQKKRETENHLLETIKNDYLISINDQLLKSIKLKSEKSSNRPPEFPLSLQSSNKKESVL